MLAIISTSLNPRSRSRKMAEKAVQIAQDRGEDVAFVDLQSWPLPQCDGASSHEHPHVAYVQEILQKAKAIIIATPIYNYSVSSSCKNLLELTGHTWKHKAVAIMAASGSIVSYMAPSSFIISLLFDFHCHIVPRTVIADASSFNEEGTIARQEIHTRIESLIHQTIALKNALEQFDAVRAK